MHIPVKVDYGIRTLVVLAAGEARSGRSLEAAQDLPPRFLGHILADLRRARLVVNHKGIGGGFRLAAPPKRSPWPRSSWRWMGL